MAFARSEQAKKMPMLPLWYKGRACFPRKGTILKSRGMPYEKYTQKRQKAVWLQTAFKDK
jgi:hypothetical protein